MVPNGGNGTSCDVRFLYAAYAGYFFIVMLSVNLVEPWNKSTSRIAPKPPRGASQSSQPVDPFEP